MLNSKQKKNITPLIIAGAGGHAMEVYSILTDDKKSYKISFFDDIYLKKEFLKCNVYNSIDQIKNELPDGFLFVLGVGKSEDRFQLKQKLESINGMHISVVSNLSKIDSKENNFDILNFAYVGPLTSIGTAVLVNTGSHIHHECSVGDFTEVSPGAILLGKSRIGKFCSIGSNATVLPSVQICDFVQIGAGSVVTKDITESGTYVGVPARKVR